MGAANPAEEEPSHPADAHRLELGFALVLSRFDDTNAIKTVQGQTCAGRSVAPGAAELGRPKLSRQAARCTQVDPSARSGAS